MIYLAEEAPFHEFPMQINGALMELSDGEILNEKNHFRPSRIFSDTGYIAATDSRRLLVTAAALSFLLLFFRSIL